MITLTRSKSKSPNGADRAAAVLSKTEVVAQAAPNQAANGLLAVRQTEAERDALLARLKPLLPDLADATCDNWVSFEQLVDAFEGKDDQANPKRSAFRQIYPLARDAFERSHGRLVHFYASPQIRAYVARTAPMGSPGLKTFRSHRPGFYFWYDMTVCPVASHLFARITQLANDARRILNARQLGECLNQLYSTTTDFLRIIEGHASAPPGLEQGRLAVITQDLDRIELRYLQVTARLLYFTGVVAGTGAAIIAALLIGTNLRDESIWLTTVVFAAIGAMLSVVQKISDDGWTVRYVVGCFYLVMLGFVRPLIGAAAGFLLQLAMTAGIIPLSTSGSAGNAYILLAGFAIGFSEKAIPDIFRRAGLGAGVPPVPGASAAATVSEETQTVTPTAPGARRRAKGRG